MTNSKSNSKLNLHLGRHVFGVSALALGLTILAWHNYNDRHLPLFIVYAAGAALIVGGIAIQFLKTAKAGAALVGAACLVFTLLCVPGIVAKPQIYNSWGNFFEQFSLLSGAVIVYARFSSSWSRETLHRISRILLGICTASFALEQAFYLAATATLVPKWIPTQMFWAFATTVLFALAAVALLSNRMALLASRLLTLMLVLFGLIVWVPLLMSEPRRHTNWSETIETFAIAGATWILADLLGE